MKREDFIKETGRWTILAFIAGLVAFFVGKRNVTAGASCPDGDFCMNCKKFSKCDRPQALEQK